MEVSAKSSINVDEAFTQTAKEILSIVEKSQPEEKQGGIQLNQVNQDNTNNKVGCGC